MISVQNAVFHKPTFQKVANYELPDDTSTWSDEILRQFFQQIDYIPQGYGTDVVINNIDENKGYAKGSVVVWNDKNKINFPIIVRDKELSPFDVFVAIKDDEYSYFPANKVNVMRVLGSNQIGMVEKKKSYDADSSIKPVGNIYPKESVPYAQELQLSGEWPPFSKLSGWPALAKKEDLEKLAETIDAQPDVAASFVENTGNMVSNIVDMKNHAFENRSVFDKQKTGVIDLTDAIRAKQAVTLIDSQLFDVSQLIPIEPPSVCELRIYEFPTMEQFLSSGADMTERFMASKSGRPISGVVLDYKSFGSNYEAAICCNSSDDPNDEKKSVRNCRPQIFISLDGRYYSTDEDYGKSGISFYGSNVLPVDKALEKAIGILASHTSDEFINQNRMNENDGADKSFNPNFDMVQGKGKRFGYCNPSRLGDEMLLVIYGAGNSYECMYFNDNYKKYIVNDTKVFVSENNAIIPANVASVQQVNGVENPIYKTILGTIKKIFLVPESSLIINAEYMKRLNRDQFMRPSLSVQKMYDDANINKVAVELDSNSGGFRISGESFEPLRKIIGIEKNASMSITNTKAALMTMGVDKNLAGEILKVAYQRAFDYRRNDKSVMVYGVRGDYINEKVFDGREKTANINRLKKDIANSLKINLIKEASALEDPEAVDVVLSLNFINEDSLGNYVSHLPEMKKVNTKLAELLVAARMGLSDVDESAIKKSMEGLGTVTDGLEKVKFAMGK